MTTPAGWHPDPHNPGQQRYWDGQQWTDHVAPAAAPTPPAYAPPAYAQPQYGTPMQQKPPKPLWQRWWFITICVLVVLGAIGAATGSGGDDDKASDKKPTSSAVDNQPADDSTPVSQPTQKAKPKPSGPPHLNADGGHDNPVQVGKSYKLGDFTLQRGWKLDYEQYLGWDIKNLVVKNTTDGQHDFLVQIKIFADSNLTRVLGNITCSTLNNTAPGEITDVTCVPNGQTHAPRVWVTIANTY